MNNDNQTAKDSLIRLIMADIEYNSSTEERAREFLEARGYDVDALVTRGLEKIHDLLQKPGGSDHVNS